MPSDRESPNLWVEARKLEREISAREDLTQGTKAVARALLDHLGKGGIICPGYARIRDQTGLDRKTVQRALKLLKERGIIEVTAGSLSTRNTKAKTNDYKFPALQHFLPRDISACDENAPRDILGTTLGSKMSLGTRVQNVPQTIIDNYTLNYSPQPPEGEARGETIPTWSDFEKIWPPQDNSDGGNRPKRMFNRLSELDRREAFERVPLYQEPLVKAGRKLCNRSTYLGERRWEGIQRPFAVTVAETNVQKIHAAGLPIALAGC